MEKREEFEEYREFEEITVEISTEEIANFLYKSLIERGFVPGPEEIEELADIMFDYLVEKALIAETEDVDEEE